MIDYSPLDGSMPLTSSTDRVLEILKKRKSGDRKGQNGKKSEGKKREETSKHLPPEADSDPTKDTELEEEKEDYGSSKRGKKATHKIDLKI